MRAMADARIEHVFECSAATFWEKVVFKEDFNRRMFLEHLHFPAWRVTSEQDRPEALIRTIEVTPAVGDLPGALKALVGDGIGYREEGRFDKAQKKYTVRAIPNKMADKVMILGEMTATDLGPGRCRRTFTVKVEAKIFAVGSVLEKRLIADMEASYAAGAVFTARYLEENGLRGT